MFELGVFYDIVMYCTHHTSCSVVDKLISCFTQHWSVRRNTSVRFQTAPSATTNGEHLLLKWRILGDTISCERKLPCDANIVVHDKSHPAITVRRIRDDTNTVLEKGKTLQEIEFVKNTYLIIVRSLLRWYYRHLVIWKMCGYRKLRKMSDFIYDMRARDGTILLLKIPFCMTLASVFELCYL